MSTIYGVQGHYTASSEHAPEPDNSGWTKEGEERKPLKIGAQMELMKAQLEDTNRLFKIKEENPHLTPEQRAALLKQGSALPHFTGLPQFSLEKKPAVVRRPIGLDNLPTGYTGLKSDAPPEDKGLRGLLGDVF